MKAIIMAGGEGRRLRPLTCQLPKPLVPVMDKPVLEHLLLLLKRNGITEVCLTLGYMADKIQRAVGDGRRWNMRIRCVTEPTPLGTAGSVKKCEEFLAGEDCLVLSGDGLMDFSVSQCIRRHQEKKAAASVILCRRHCPLAYGVVAANQEGWLSHFEEKPTWGRVCSDLVNTGVYILSNALLSEIPKDRFWDFGHDFFPALFGKMRRYWAYWQTAIGAISETRRPIINAAAMYCREPLTGSQCPVWSNIKRSMGKKYG